MLEKSSKLLNKNSLSILKGKKNLLAFSAGVDSTALFFLLLDENIEFDIAIVNYQRRESSKHEVEYANSLATKYKKRCFIKEVSIDSGSNFQKMARDIRYHFFKECIDRYSYENLLTAHQLNDRVEWFLMQFTKGAGAVELAGFDMVQNREGYKIVRPLIESTKESLLKYLTDKKIKYFEDSSNKELKYRRNRFRHYISDTLLKEGVSGIKNSFRYLKNDSDKLLKIEIKKEILELSILKNLNDNSANIRAIDKIIKKLGVIISSKEREEIIRQKEIVLRDKIAVSIRDDSIYIAPYIRVPLDKKFKELCRVLKIPPKIRGYLLKNQIDPKEINL